MNWNFQGDKLLGLNEFDACQKLLRKSESLYWSLETLENITKTLPSTPEIWNINVSRECKQIIGSDYELENVRNFSCKGITPLNNYWAQERSDTPF